MVKQGHGGSPSQSSREVDVIEPAVFAVILFELFVRSDVAPTSARRRILSWK